MDKITARQAIAQAHVITKCPSVKHPKAIANLAKYFADNSIFEPLEDHDDYDSFEERCNTEREHDPLCELDGENARQNEQEQREHRMKIAEDAAHLSCPELAFRKQINEAITSNPDSPDYQDPSDCKNTKLHKLVIDNDLHQIRHYVQELGANLFLRNSEGFDPLGLALNLGLFEVAQYLRDAVKIATHQVVRSARTA